MKRIAIFILILITVPAFAFREEPRATEADQEITISWDDLLPESDRAYWENQGPVDHSSVPSDNPFDNASSASNIGLGVNWDLVDTQVRLPGFILPLDYDPSTDGYGGSVTEFLLVPYVGACVHVPPPPPNQILYVQLDEPIEVEDLWYPIWVIGELKAEAHNNALGDTAYTLNVERWQVYEY